MGVGLTVIGQLIGPQIVDIIVSFEENQCSNELQIEQTTMRNSGNFVNVASFGNLIIEGCNFTNASGYAAITLAFYDENLTPNQTTIRNCIFENNSNNYQGGAFTFKSLAKVSNQFSLNVLMVNTTFRNSQGRKIYLLSRSF